MARVTPNAHPEVAAIFKRLDALAERAPELAEPIAFYRAALPMLHDAQTAVAPFRLSPEAARRKLQSGLPLLIGEDLPIDLDATRGLLLRLCRIVEGIGTPNGRPPAGRSLFSRGRPDPARLLDRARNGDGASMRSAAAAQIRRAVERDALDLTVVFGALAAGEVRRVEIAASELQLDAELLQTLAQNSLKPALRAWAQSAIGSLDLSHWQRGICPACGSPPVISEIQGKEGARRLRCATCGSGWHYPRLRCAFCGNDDHRSLGTLAVDGEDGKYRAQTCGICLGYIKVVVTFDPTPVSLLPVEDLTTLHLDLIAIERGFSRAAGKG